MSKQPLVRQTIFITKEQAEHYENIGNVSGNGKSAEIRSALMKDMHKGED